jgi:hypothetical protein
MLHHTSTSFLAETYRRREFPVRSAHIAAKALVLRRAHLPSSSVLPHGVPSREASSLMGSILLARSHRMPGCFGPSPALGIAAIRSENDAAAGPEGCELRRIAPSLLLLPATASPAAWHLLHYSSATRTTALKGRHTVLCCFTASH